MADEPKGLQPFDLGPPRALMVPTYTPFRPDNPPAPARRRETPYQRELAVRLAQARVEWLELYERMEGNAVARGVLDLHQPEREPGKITCEECASHDNEGLSTPDWPCSTYTAVSQS